MAPAVARKRVFTIKEYKIIIKVFVIVFIQFVTAEYSVLYTSPNECSANQYYDAASMKCLNCGTEMRRKNDGTYGNCECTNGKVYDYNKDKTGTVITICKSCASDEIPSEDGWKCVKCDKNCQTCAGSGKEKNIFSERQIDGGKFVNSNGLSKICMPCKSDTVPSPDRKRCIPCWKTQQFHKLEPLKTQAQRNHICDCKISLAEFCLLESSHVVKMSEEARIPTKGSDVVNSDHINVYGPIAASLCEPTYKNATTCQHLANMCALQYFSKGSWACSQYITLTQNYKYGKDQEEFISPIPWMYVKGSGNLFAGGINEQIPAKFTFAPSLQSSKLKFMVAGYSLDGTFLGWSNVTGGLLQLCLDSMKKLDAAYQFGTKYAQKCELKALDLFNQKRYPLIFYDLYLQFTENSEQKMFIVPVLNLNMKDEGVAKNTLSKKDWTFVRRFFLVDSVASNSITCKEHGLAEYSRYAKSMTFTIKLRTEENGDKGYIYPPYLTVDYDAISCADALAGKTVQVEFNVNYEMDEDEYDRNFKIAAGTIGTIMSLYAMFRTWVWSKRAGRSTIDFLDIINFVFYVAASLSNAFFILTFGTSFYWLVFFKNQEYATLVLPTEWAYINFLALLGSAFALRVLQLAHVIFCQCTTDIFLIDWERPNSSVKHMEANQDKKSNGISIWRTYFVANEFNEMQSNRKLSVTLQMLFMVFFLEVVGFVNVSTFDGNGTIYAPEDEYHGPQSPIFRYAVSTLIFLLIALVQWLLVWVYNHFVDDPVQSFVDLCSMCNVSVFIMSHAQYGHYIHGLSVHGKGDADLREMHEMMKREEDDLCGQRGLMPNQSQQTFEISLPWKLRNRYDQMFLPVAMKDVGNAGQTDKSKKGSRIIGTPLEKTLVAYHNLNKLLSAFIDHSLKEIDYIVQDKSILEKILDTEFLDNQERGIFYNDNGHSFTNVLLHGNEVTLLLFDLLCFSIVDLIATDYILSAIITYIISQIIVYVRAVCGRKNLTRKTLVDERFLI